MSPHDQMLDERNNRRKEMQDKIAAWIKNPKDINGEIDLIAAEDQALFTEAITAYDEHELADTLQNTHLWEHTPGSVKDLVKVRGGTLKRINEWREQLGLPKIKKLPAGLRGQSENCVIANAIQQMGLQGVAVGGGDIQAHDANGRDLSHVFIHNDATKEFINQYDEGRYVDLDLDDCMGEWEDLQDEIHSVPKAFYVDGKLVDSEPAL